MSTERPQISNLASIDFQYSQLSQQPSNVWNYTIKVKIIYGEIFWIFEKSIFFYILKLKSK